MVHKYQKRWNHIITHFLVSLVTKYWCTEVLPDWMTNWMKCAIFFCVLRNILFTYQILSLRKFMVETHNPSENSSHILLMWSISLSSLKTRILLSPCLHVSFDSYYNFEPASSILSLCRFEKNMYNSEFSTVSMKAESRPQRWCLQSPLLPFLKYMKWVKGVKRCKLSVIIQISHGV